MRSRANHQLVEIPGVLSVAVDPLASMHPSGEIWGMTGHPLAPEENRLRRRAEGQRLQRPRPGAGNNSGRNGHYAPINWFESFLGGTEPTAWNRPVQDPTAVHRNAILAALSAMSIAA